MTCPTVFSKPGLDRVLLNSPVNTLKLRFSPGCSQPPLIHKTAQSQQVVCLSSALSTSLLPAQYSYTSAISNCRNVPREPLPGNIIKSSSEAAVPQKKGEKESHLDPYPCPVSTQQSGNISLGWEQKRSFQSHNKNLYHGANLVE